MTQEVTPSQVEVTQADALAFANEAFRNIDMPRLSNAEMRDIEGALRGFLRRDRARFEEQTRTATEREVLTVAANAVEAARKTWFCSGADCTDYDHGRDEGLQFARDAIRALSEQKS